MHPKRGSLEYNSWVHNHRYIQHEAKTQRAVRTCGYTLVHYTPPYSPAWGASSCFVSYKALLDHTDTPQGNSTFVRTGGALIYVIGGIQYPVIKCTSLVVCISFNTHILPVLLHGLHELNNRGEHNADLVDVRMKWVLEVVKLYWICDSWGWLHSS